MKKGLFHAVAFVVLLISSACGSLDQPTRTAAATPLQIPNYCAHVTRPSGERFYRCKVKLAVTGGQLTMSVDPFYVPSDLPVVAVWVLPQNGYYFGADDGIFVSSPNGQFVDPCPSDDDGTCSTVTKPTRFKWKVKNSGAFSSPYCIQFHDASGASFAFDPTIANSLGFIKVASPPIAKADGVCK